MATFFRVCSLALALTAVAASPLHADPRWSEYRGVTLGDSAAATIEQLRLLEPAKVLFTEPALVEELTWRPHRFISGTVVSPDPLSDVVLTFLNGRLVTINATYDRDRTAGLTDADFLELLAHSYGPPQLASRVLGAVRPGGRQSLGTWGDDSVLVRLWTETHPRRVGLTISSNNEAALQAAIAGAAVAEREAAPQRELAKQAAAAAARKDLEEKTRLANKANFKP